MMPCLHFYPMIKDELSRQIREHFPFEPTLEQSVAIDTFALFLADPLPGAAMIMRGSAGTGKTSLASAIVRSLIALKLKSVLLAPTGRAAKVFSLNAGSPASTIHRKIYRQRSMLGSFSLNDNLHTNTLFMVDESSMISNESRADSVFGSGCLLDDLVQYVYSGRDCRLMLIGDKAQLPPVGEEQSPALSAAVMGAYGLHVHQCDLWQVLRQADNSGILWNATRIRNLSGALVPQVRFRGFADITRVSGEELIDRISASYADVGVDETMVITRSNKRANLHNQGIRAMVLGREEGLATGDLLMIVKNNYRVAAEGLSDNVPSYLANGDRCVVQRVRHMRELYGFHFADVRLEFPDYDGFELQTTAILDSLTSEAPALTREQNDQLFTRVMEDYEYLTRKADRMDKLRQDPYYNAVQVKYGYAVTCHKAQGGQWAHVYIDQGYMPPEMFTPDYIHWLYTAFTRATSRLFLINWPEEQTEE